MKAANMGSLNSINHSGDNVGVVFDWSSVSRSTNRHFQTNSFYFHAFSAFYLKFKLYFSER